MEREYLEVYRLLSDTLDVYMLGMTSVVDEIVKIKECYPHVYEETVNKDKMREVFGAIKSTEHTIAEARELLDKIRSKPTG